jgi:hypothetical protein
MDTNLLEKNRMFIVYIENESFLCTERKKERYMTIIPVQLQSACYSQSIFLPGAIKLVFNISYSTKVN